MMSKDEIFDAFPEVEVYLKKIIDRFNPQKVILFGSKATGKASKTSDTDFAIITSKPFDENAIIGALDIVNYNRVDEGLKKEINEEGILLYEQETKEVS